MYIRSGVQGEVQDMDTMRDEKWFPRQLQYIVVSGCSEHMIE